MSHPLPASLFAPAPTSACIGASGDASVRFRDPASVIAVDVCPKCLHPLQRHQFNAGGLMVYTSHCQEHGDVVPMRRASYNSRV